MIEKIFFLVEEATLSGRGAWVLILRFVVIIVYYRCYPRIEHIYRDVINRFEWNFGFYKLVVKPCTLQTTHSNKKASLICAFYSFGWEKKPKYSTSQVRQHSSITTTKLRIKWIRNLFFSLKFDMELINIKL